jgi:uncharacterized SAM-binding protein YcdF (DUF218 family)
MRGRGITLQRVLALALMALAVLWVGSVIAVVSFGRRNDAEHADAIVVLGAAQYWGQPSPVLKERLNHAIALWKDGYAPLMVLTGGTGRGDTTTEAEVGRKYAMSRGVPDSAIIVENRGRTTKESLRTVAAILKARNMRKAILVSDPFHMLRLRILAGKLDLTVRSSPTRTSPISASPSQYWSYVLSESLKAPLAFILEKS